MSILHLFTSRKFSRAASLIQLGRHELVGRRLIVQSSDYAPTDQARAAYALLKAQLQRIGEQYRVLLRRDLAVFNDKLRRRGLAVIPPGTRFSGSLLQPPVEPADHRVMPEDGVGRLEHPVVLVGEVEELARDAPPLQDVERPDPLSFHDPEILAAVDD